MSFLKFFIGFCGKIYVYVRDTSHTHLFVRKFTIYMGFLVHANPNEIINSYFNGTPCCDVRIFN